MRIPASCLVIVVAGAVCATAHQQLATPGPRPGLDPYRRPEARLTTADSRPLSSFPGSHRWPTFSPDGRMIAFVSDADGSPQLWMAKLAGGDPTRLTSGNLDPSHPSWSPRNDQIVFQGGEGAETQGIWSVSPRGGPPRRIVEFAFAPNFSADGSKIAFHRGGAGVFICAADGTGQKVLDHATAVPQCSLDDGPVFSPDGTLLAIYPAAAGIGDLWVVPVASGEPKKLTADDCAGGHPVWVPDGSAIVFSSTRMGSRTLWRVPAAGGKPEPVTSGAGDDDQPAVSRHGRRLAFTTARTTYALMALDVATGESRQVLEQRAPIVSPIFSPRGDWVAFASTGPTGRQEGTRVFLVASDGTKLQHARAEPGGLETGPGWSADGQSVYFFHLAGDADGLTLRRAALGGGPSIELWAPGQRGFIGAVDLSPDGRRIAFTGEWQGEPRAAFVRDLATGSVTKVPVPLEQPQWSHDGRFLIGNVFGQPFNTFICPPTGEPCTDWGTGPALAPFWSHDDSEVFLTVPGGTAGTWKLVAVKRDGSSDRPVADLPGAVFLTGFPRGVSSRGMASWVQLRSGRHEIWIADLES
jgi:Tol biopolymer transport system component